MIYQRKNRRMFLTDTGKFFLSMPFLPSLLTAEEARAQSSQKMTRFIAVLNGNGDYGPTFWPNRKLYLPNKDIGSNAREIALSQISGPLSPTLGADFDAVRGKISLLRGLDHAYENGGHIGFCSLSGASWHPSNYLEFNTKLHSSIDAVLSKSSKMGGTTYPLISCGIGRSAVSGYYNIKSAAEGTIPGATLPTQFSYSSSTGGTKAFFDTYFKNLMTGSAPAPSTPSKLKNVMDFVLKDFRSLSQSSKISADDRNRLAAHAELIFEADRKLGQQIVAAACVKPGEPVPQVPEFEIADGRSHRMMTDLLITAIQCNLSRVFVMQLTEDLDLRHFDNLGLKEEYHGITHSDLSSRNPDGTYTDTALANLKKLGQIQKFLAQEYAYLIRSLDQIQDVGGGTLLDNSFAMYANCGGDSGHGLTSKPIIVAGSAGGVVRTGYYIDYRNFNARYGEHGNYAYSDAKPGEVDSGDDGFIGRDYNQLLYSITQIFGLTSAEYQHPHVAPGFGADDVRDNGRRGGVPMSNRTSVLPGLMKG